MRLALIVMVVMTGCTSTSAPIAAPPGPLTDATDSAPRKLPDPVFGIDKVKHFFIAGFVESVVFASAEAVGSRHSAARSLAIGTAAAVSVGREIHDLRAKGQFSFRDLAWDALGVGAALLVVNKTQR